MEKKLREALRSAVELLEMVELRGRVALETQFAEETVNEIKEALQ